MLPGETAASCGGCVVYSDPQTRTLKVISGLEHGYGIKILPSSHRDALSYDGDVSASSTFKACLFLASFLWWVLSISELQLRTTRHRSDGGFGMSSGVHRSPRISAVAFGWSCAELRA